MCGVSHTRLPETEKTGQPKNVGMKEDDMTGRHFKTAFWAYQIGSLIFVIWNFDIFLGQYEDMKVLVENILK